MSDAYDKNSPVKKVCEWTRAFDLNFNISCSLGERAYGQFKGKDKGATWEFIYCPYCGGKIEEIESENNGEKP